MDFMEIFKPFDKEELNDIQKLTIIHDYLHDRMDYKAEISI